MTFDEWWNDDDLLADPKELASRAFAAGKHTNVPKLRLTTEEVIADARGHRWVKLFEEHTPEIVELMAKTDDYFCIGRSWRCTLSDVAKVYRDARWSDPIQMPEEA